MFRGKKMLKGIAKRVELIWQVGKELKKIVKEIKGNLLALRKKITDFQSKVLGEIETLHQDLTTIKTYLQAEAERKKGVHFLVDGDYALHQLYRLDRRLNWWQLRKKVEEVYGGVAMAFFYVAKIPPSLKDVISKAGYDVVDTSISRPGEKEFTDEALLRYIEKVAPSVLILFTGDRELKRKATQIASEKGIELIFLDFSPEFPYPVRDTAGKIVLDLYLPLHLTPEQVTPPNIWEEVLERFLQDRSVDPEKEERDRLLVEAVRYLFYILPSHPRKEGVRIPVGFMHLAGLLDSYFHALQHFEPFHHLYPDEGDAIAILNVLVKKELLREVKIGGMKLYYRTPHSKWEGLRNWIPALSKE